MIYDAQSTGIRNLVGFNYKNFDIIYKICTLET